MNCSVLLMTMRSLENPISKIAQATEAAAKMVSLQADLFFLKQEIKGLRKLKQAIWLAITFFIFTLFVSLTLYWIEVGLHEQGFSAFQVAAFSFFGLGTLTLLALIISIRVGREPQTQKQEEGKPHAENFSRRASA